MEFDLELDARGLMCPIPILKTKAMIDRMSVGQVLKIVATDAGSVRDMEAFARHTNNPLLHSRVEGSEYVYFLRKAGAPA